MRKTIIGAKYLLGTNANAKNNNSEKLICIRR